MKQKIMQIESDDVEKLNEEGWQIKQVISVCKGYCACDPTWFWVLLETENKDEKNN